VRRGAFDNTVDAGAPALGPPFTLRFRVTRLDWFKRPSTTGEDYSNRCNPPLTASAAIMRPPILA
jgi:hypothetical protein